ncbi:MAG: OmpH family outer membrane protein [Verrucomicrobia bacterium]|nr:OmpH family outer membrane protein [Verrucomicrobiota bacterium]
MKRIVCAAALLMAGLVTLSVPAQAQSQIRIAVVDLKKVFDGYWRTKQADSQLKERAADFEKARNGLIEDYKKSNDEFRTYVESAQDPALSADEREKRKKDLEKKQTDLREQEASIRTFDQNSRQALAEQQGRMRESVLRDIRGVVDEKARVGGFSLVLDVAATTVNQTPVVMYNTLAGTDADLSDAVLKQLNLNAPPDAAKTDAAPAEDKK